jgi:serine/threonine protein kinase
VCVLSDFGISRVVDNNNLLTLQHFEFSALIGLSAPYAAPESWLLRRSKVKVLDRTSAFAGDVFSWSIVLYETVNRSRPWKRY